MAKVKKFGTFGGVFTPSILTILGVIMYLRFPTIIGQAGLINTIGIIVIAHIISITTSLSVASLSTDKTVKIGGTYFMISRSLGLPIGGTLGLALFVGLSFSVSLYLIGFAESFLAYWSLDTSIGSVRITGTIILILVTTLTFVSTSLAIKSQYFIMAAIALSLVSIFVGSHDLQPTEVNWGGFSDSAPFMLLFGIFFPAVTGFEAGVSMSGDLKDPKKSLPVGAIAAVVVGFVAYVILAFFYAYTVDADSLRNDPQVLFKISWSPSLVIAGIWGATLSSALGSILGAPRILQAIAMDKIVPKVFAVGSGKTNEPRNALLLAFVIAEMGILIGELDVIARIVSMFFITTYAFLNLACAIENWSSSDFRPAFKIPRFVSILGAISAFIVMILLDFVALIGAVLVLGLLFYYLKRKELTLETGDAWNSFWTNLAKRALFKLADEKTDIRNWRPNLILFSGGAHARPHLVDFGLALSGKLGVLTDFELITDKATHSAKEFKPDAGTIYHKHYFRRTFQSDTLIEGIKTVTNIYGFSGFEPNTIMMGWSRNIQNVDFLIEAQTHFKQKNLNAVFLDYNAEHGFGKKENIDIWWGGMGRHLSFTLSLMKFFLSHPDWRDANLRVLIVNKHKHLTDKLYFNTNIILEEARIQAEVKIINNEFETRTIQGIIQEESASADMLVLGIPEGGQTHTGRFIQMINNLSQLESSLMLLSSSNSFEEINLVESSIQRPVLKPTVVMDRDLPPLPKLTDSVLGIRVEKLDEELQGIGLGFFEKCFEPAIASQLSLVQGLRKYTEQHLNGLAEISEQEKEIRYAKKINKLHQTFLSVSEKLFDGKGRDVMLLLHETMQAAIQSSLNELDTSLNDAPRTILLVKQKKSNGKKKSIQTPYRELIRYYLYQGIYPAWYAQLQSFEEATESMFQLLKNTIFEVHDLYQRVEHRQPVNHSQADASILAAFDTIKQRLEAQVSASRLALLHNMREQVSCFAKDLAHPLAKKLIKQKRKINKEQGEIVDALYAFPDEWHDYATAMNEAVYLDCLVLSEQKIISGIVKRTNERIGDQLESQVLVPIGKMIKGIESDKTLKQILKKEISLPDSVMMRELFQDSYTKISEFTNRLPEELTIAEPSIVLPDASTTPHLVANVEPNKIARYYLDTRLYEPFYRELEQFDSQVIHSIVNTKEIQNRLRFTIENVDDTAGEESLDAEGAAQIKENFVAELQTEKDGLLEAFAQLKDQADNMLNNAISPIFSHTIIQSEKKISTQIREQKGRTYGTWFQGQIARLRQLFTDKVVNLIYSTSDGVILAKKYIEDNQEARTPISRILTLSEKEKPAQSVLAEFPVFYQTLFSSTSSIIDDFWVPREAEMQILKNILKRHKDGHRGAVLITGRSGMGKTELAHYFAHKFFKKDRIFTIQPIEQGTCSTVTWLTQLQKATGIVEDGDAIFNKIPPKSIVVINDLELWWERSAQGYGVLHEIIRLIHRYGKQVFFLIECNSDAFHQINKSLQIEDVFGAMIRCSPFDTQQIQQLILSRHRSSGLDFYYRDDVEGDISPFRLAALFNSYFNYSGGSPGLALQTWLGNITSVEGQAFHIKKPEIPNTDMLDSLDKDWLIVIALLAQHKNMTVSKLARLLNAKEENAAMLIDTFYHGDMLESKDGDIYHLNKYLEPFLVAVCEEKGIL